MMILLTLVPWVLTAAALVAIIMIVNRQEDESLSEEESMLEEIFHQSKDVIRVAVYDDKAYWVYDNVFYESDVMREPDFETARPINTMDLDPKELNDLLNILDELEQHNNERD